MELEVALQLDYRAIVVPPYSILYISVETILTVDPAVDIYFYYLYFSEVFYRRTTFDQDLLKSENTFNTPTGFNIVTIEADLRHYFISQVHFLLEIFTTKNLVLFNDLIHTLIKQLLLVGSLMGKKEDLTASYADVDHDIIRSFRVLLDENIATQKTVMFYADALGISPRRLSLACKALLGITAKQFISKSILKEAKRRLLYTTESVREIAWKLGYEEENNFSAFFMKEAKLSPSTYRKAYHHRGES